MKGKRTKTILWILIPALAILAAAGLTVGLNYERFFGGQHGETDPSQYQGEGEMPPIYYCMDYEYYGGMTEGGLSSRTKEDDGLYHIKVSVNGLQKEILTDQYRFVNMIDSRPFSCISVDERNWITEVKRTDECGYTLLLESGYVQKFDRTEGIIRANIDESMSGYAVTIPLNEKTILYDTMNTVEPVPEVEMEVGAHLGVLRYDPENALVVVVFPASVAVMDRMYWNIDRMWNSEIQETTREPDENGDYVFRVYHNGEETTVKTKILDLARRIDSYAFRCFSARFDKNGYIVYVTRCQDALNGRSAASWFTVMNFENEEQTAFFAKKIAPGSDQGHTETVTMAEDCRVFNVGGPFEDHGGEYSSVKLGDQVHCILNGNDEAEIIFIISHRVDSRVYWNISRQYDSVKKETKRTADANGYYTFLMAVDGKQVTLRTSDRAIATEIDAVASKHMGLSLNGDIITAVYTTAASKISGYFGSAASWFHIDAFSDSTQREFTAKKYGTASDAGQVVTLKLSDDCVVYNVSGNTVGFAGEATKLQLHDQVHCLLNQNEEASFIFVVNRYNNTSIYWNVERKYDSKKLETKRTPEADGLYHFIMAVDGTKKEVVTADKAIANRIDSFAGRNMGLILKADGKTVERVVGSNSVYRYIGGSSSSWCNVQSISKNTFTTKKLDDQKSSYYLKTFTESISPTMKVYNVSGFYDGETDGHFAGEPTNLRVGDKVHVLLNSLKQAELVFVVARQNPVTAHKDAHACYDCGKQVTWTPWTDGTTLPTSTGHYYLTGPVALTVRQELKENANVVLCLNGYTVTGAPGARVYDGVGAKSSLTIIGEVAGSTIRAGKSEGKDIAGHILYTRNADVKIFGGTYDASAVSTNVQASAFFTSKDRALELHHATVIGGKAGGTGGSILAVNGSKVLFDHVTFRGGEGRMKEVVCLNSAEMILKGTLTFENVPEGGCAVYLNGGRLTLDGFTGGNISVKSASGSGKITSNYETGAEEAFVSADPEYTVTTGDGTALVLTAAVSGDPHIHCICGGNTLTAGGHTHQSAEWLPWTLDNALPAGQDADGLFYYLTKDVTISESVSLKDAKVTICLAGHKILANTMKAFTVTNGELTITDCTDSGVFEGQGTYTKAGGLISLLAGSKFNLYGGTLDASAVTVSYGSVLYAENAKAVNIYGGEILGGTATGDGGAFYIPNGTTFTMYGGEIAGGTAGARGGNFFMGGAAYIYGGTVTGGRAETFGGNIYQHSNPTYIGNAMISGGTARSGGNIYVNTHATPSLLPKLTVDGAVITGGTAVQSGSSGGIGGNILSKVEVIIRGGTISNGRTVGTQPGGNIGIIEAGGRLVLSGGTVTGGQSEHTAGGGIAVFSGTVSGSLVLSGGTVKGNLGGIYVGSGDVTVSGKVVIDGNEGTNLTLNKRPLRIDGSLDEGTRISLTASPAVTFAPSEVDYHTYFASDDPAYEVIYDETAKAHRLFTDRSNVKLDIYLLAGQSNANGSSSFESAKEGERDSNIYENVRYYSYRANRNGEVVIDHPNYESVREGLGYGATFIGPELGMAAVLNEQYEDADKQALILKFAAGGTTLTRYELDDGSIWNESTLSDSGLSAFVTHGSWYPTSLESETSKNRGENRATGFLLRDFISSIRQVYEELLLQGYRAENITFKDLNWMQGESDRSYPEEYSAIFPVMVSELRAAVSEITGRDYSKLPVVVGEISETFNVTKDSQRTLNQAFIAMQNGLPDIVDHLTVIPSGVYEINALVNGQYVAVGTDSSHWSYGDMLKIGRMFAEALDGTATGEKHQHAIAGAEEMNASDPTVHTEVEWQEWTLENALPKTAGYWYLNTPSKTVTLTSTQQYTDPAGVYLCLNGHTVTAKCTRPIQVTSGGSLTVTDCGHGKYENIEASVNKGGGLFSISGGSSLHLYGLSLDASKLTSNLGSVFYIDNAADRLNVYQCDILAGKSSGGGGAIYLNKGKALLWNTTISGGVSTSTSNGGGNILLASGEMEIIGGEIEKGVATGAGGGNILIRSASTLKLSGAVTDGYASSNGYNIRVEGTLLMEEGARIEGRGVYNGVTTKNQSVSTNAANAKITISGGVIAENLQTVNATSTVTMTGGRIGGTVEAYTGTITIEDGYFADELKIGTGTLSVRGGYFVKNPSDSFIVSGFKKEGGPDTVYTNTVDSSDTTVYRYRVVPE